MEKVTSDCLVFLSDGFMRVMPEYSATDICAMLLTNMLVTVINVMIFF